MIPAITTKYIPATDKRGSRIKATHANGESTTIGYDSALSSERNNVLACRVLASKLGLRNRWVGGSTREGYVFVNGDDAQAWVSV